MSERMVRCVRVIEYIGPESWVKETLQQSAVGPRGTRFRLGTNKQIAEIARTTKFVGPTAIEAKGTYSYELGSGGPDETR